VAGRRAGTHSTCSKRCLLPSSRSIPDEAQSVAVEALEEIIKQIESVESLEMLRGRLYSCAKRRALDLIKHKQCRKNVILHAEPIDQENNPHENIPDDPSSMSVIESVEYEELRSIAADLLDTLPSDIKQVLKESHMDDLKQREIGDIHGWETSSVGKRIDDALKRAKKLLSSDPRLKKFNWFNK